MPSVVQYSSVSILYSMSQSKWLKSQVETRHNVTMIILYDISAQHCYWIKYFTAKKTSRSTPPRLKVLVRELGCYVHICAYTMLWHMCSFIIKYSTIIWWYSRGAPEKFIAFRFVVTSRADNIIFVIVFVWARTTTVSRFVWDIISKTPKPSITQNRTSCTVWFHLYAYPHARNNTSCCIAVYG